MTVQHIHHYSISAPSQVLNELVDFYGDVLGVMPGERPDFGIPGHWLYAQGEPIIHLIEDGQREKTGKGYLDHIALRCVDREQVRTNLEAQNIEFSEFEFKVGNTGQAQIVFSDPAGNSIELNFLTD